MSEVLKFSLDLIELPVELGDKQYILREATGDVASKYRNATFGSARLSSDGGTTTFGNIGDVEPLLVSLCLFEVRADPDKDGYRHYKRVNESIVRSWPARIQRTLFDKIKKISDLDEPDTMESLQKDKAEIDKKIADFEKNASSAKNSETENLDGSE